MTCTHCGRRYRSKASRTRAERYAAINEELRGGTPAPHLAPLIDAREPYVSRRQRHIAASEDHRRGLN